MNELAELLTAVARIAVIPVIGYAVACLACRWPRVVLAVLALLIAAGAVALGYAASEGYSVDPTSRQMTFGSDSGRWCFAIGGTLLVLAVPGLPLVAMARAEVAAAGAPARYQWVIALFGYFMACAIFGMVLYSWLTGIVK